jgi:hypothetical protein
MDTDYMLHPVVMIQQVNRYSFQLTAAPKNAWSQNKNKIFPGWILPID